MPVHFIVSDSDFKTEINNICPLETIPTKPVDISLRARAIPTTDTDDPELNLIVTSNL